MVYVEGIQGYSNSELRPEISASPFWKHGIHIGTMKSFLEVLEDANRGEKGCSDFEYQYLTLQRGKYN